MPFYCYSTSDGHVEERFFRMGEAPATITLDDGRAAERDFAAEHAPRRAGSGWPMTCFASGVNAEQSGELRDFLAKAGVPTEVTPDGDPVYTSAAHRKRALKARGFFDRQSYC